MDNSENYSENDQMFEDSNIKDEIVRYFNFWPWFLVSVIFLLISTYIYLRYSKEIYQSYSKIQVVDKAQDS